MHSVLPSRSVFLALGVAGLLTGVCMKAEGCGLNWSQPKSHFEGVSFQGYVFLVESLGDIVLKDGKKLPVWALFRSESNTTSPYLGHGWELPLLESRIVQLDERWFRVVEPTGWYRYFWRDEKDPTVLHGQNNWKGVIRGNSISVMADCGDRLDFRDGRIVSMDLKGRKLQIERTTDGTVALKDDSSTLLVVQKGLTKEGLEMKWGNGELLEITQVARPLVEVIGGRAVIGRKVESLGAITRGNGEKRTWEYAVDEKLRPSLKQGDRLITWNPTTRYIVSDADWTYDIKPGEGPRDANAAIGRTNAQGQKEFWYHDKIKGEEIVQGINGVKKVTSWFTSGKLAGKMRRIEEFANDKSRLLYQASYDEYGNLFRELLENGETNQFVYSEDGGLKTKIRFTKTGEPKSTKEYVDGGRVTIARSSDGRTIEYHFDEKGRESKMIINGNLHSETYYGPNHSWEQVVVYDQTTGEATRTFYTELDERGRVLTERITEHSRDYPEIYREFFYNHAGQLVKKLDTQEGAVEYLDGPDGERIARLLK